MVPDSAVPAGGRGWSFAPKIDPVSGINEIDKTGTRNVDNGMGITVENLGSSQRESHGRV
jgi:hypothetical protein